MSDAGRIQGAPGESWAMLVRKNGTPEFDAAFAPGATLDASVLQGQLVGPKAIGAFFGATSGGMYQRLSFVSETADGAATCYEWSGRAFDIDLGGATIVRRNREGLIESVSLYHRPYPAIIRFAAELAKRLKGKIEAQSLVGDRVL